MATEITLGASGALMRQVTVEYGAINRDTARAMSRRDLELANEAFRAANAQPPDFATVNRLFHPDHVFASLVSGVGQGELKGAAGYRAFLEEAEETMRWEAEIEGAVDLGEGKVLLVSSIGWRTPSSETTLETRAWMIATIRSDRIIRTEVYPEPAQALEASKAH